MKPYKMWKMTWPEISEALKETEIVLVPVGSVEQHGYHMPLETDVFLSQRICELCAEACQEQGTYVAVANPINYGVAWYHMEFPGTVSISQKLFIDYVFEVCSSLYKHGFKKIILVNSHGGNHGALTVVSNLLHEVLGERVYVARWREMAADLVKDIVTGGIHADDVETSLALAAGLDVRMDMLVNEAFNRYEVLKDKGKQVSTVVKYDALHKGPFVAVSMDYIKEISDSGVVGDATKANLELGQAVLSRAIQTLTKVCVDLSK
jgi:creatinine amidohydrolase